MPYTFWLSRREWSERPAAVAAAAAAAEESKARLPRYSGNGIVPVGRSVMRDAGRSDNAAPRQYTPRHNMGAETYGRAVQIDPIKPTLQRTGNKRLKLKCDMLLSTSAFKFNLRCYHMATEKWVVGAWWATYAYDLLAVYENRAQQLQNMR